jgi:hypothetical protein
MVIKLDKMELIDSNIPKITKTYYHLSPLNIHSSYTKELEYSDMIIAPRSLLYSIQQLAMPLPAIFTLSSKRPGSSYVFACVLEFTAEEGRLYIPT